MQLNAERNLRGVPAAVSGTTFSPERFAFVERSEPDFGLVRDVLDGRLAGVILRGLIPQAECDAIANNFWKHPLVYRRGTDAPAYYVGSYHYDKEMDDYLGEVAASDPYLDLVFAGARNWHAAFIQAVAGELAGDGVEVRLARHGGRDAGRFVLRSWSGGGDYSLLPHEDEAQCRAPRQAGFEIQQAARHPLVAVNMCLQNGGRGGLTYWNVMPDDASRDALGLTYTGSPYPSESLAAVDRQVVPIHAGDVYFFNGKAIHAVEALAGPTEQRSTISFLMARLDDSTVVQWT